MPGFIRLFAIIGLIGGMLAVLPAFAEVKVGEVAPDCQLDQLKNGELLADFDLNQTNGQVIYVDFWASWCPPCVKSFPFLNQLEAHLKSQGFQVIGINLDEDIEDAKTFLEKYPVEFTIAIDSDKQCAKDFNVMAMPSSYLIDRKGVVRKIHRGFRMDDVQEIQLAIEHILAER